MKLKPYASRTQTSQNTLILLALQGDIFRHLHRMCILKIIIWSWPNCMLLTTFKKLFFSTTTWKSQISLFVAREYRYLWVLRILFPIVFRFLFLSSCWSWCFISFPLFVKGKSLAYSVLVLLSVLFMFRVNPVQKLSQHTNYNCLTVNSKCSLTSYFFKLFLAARIIFC